MKSLTDIFQQNKNIVINTDIDGILSGIFLQKYFDCNIVGFCNSKDKVWISNRLSSVYEPVYIDMFVVNRDVTCIEQHLISVDDTHHNYWTSCNNKIGSRQL